ncbi:hypothetical protein C7U60_08050 [Mesorhizobium plurifarium]|nr:hypothetical protein C7U60_08050 [Mesorhizobium plurifarium]
MIGSKCCSDLCASDRTRGAVGNLSEECNLCSFLISVPVTEIQRCGAGKRDEEINQAAAGVPNLNRPRNAWPPQDLPGFQRGSGSCMRRISESLVLAS